MLVCDFSSDSDFIHMKSKVRAMRYRLSADKDEGV